MKKQITASLVAAILVGCGGGSSSNNPNQPTNPNEPTNPGELEHCSEKTVYEQVGFDEFFLSTNECNGVYEFESQNNIVTAAYWLTEPSKGVLSHVIRVDYERGSVYESETGTTHKIENGFVEHIQSAWDNGDDMVIEAMKNQWTLYPYKG